MRAPLAEKLVHQFAPHVRLAGEECHRDGRVRIVESEPEFALAEVDGDDVYDVAMRWEDGAQWSGACTCSAFRATGPCPHLWALVLTLDEIESGGARASRSRAESRDAAEREGGAARSKSIEPWRARLAEWHRHSARMRTDPWTAAEAHGSRIEYVIGNERAFAASETVLTVFVRKRLKTGKWGTRKAYEPATDGARFALALDRTILGNLERRERAVDWAAAGPIAGRHRLSSAQIEVLLPLLASTGRAYCEPFPDPLAWDGGEPWVLGFEIARRESKEHSVLDAFVARDSERMPLAEVVLVLAESFVVARGKVARLDPRGALAIAASLRADGPILVPTEREVELVQSVIEAPGAPLFVADGVTWKRDVAPVPHLFVERPATRSSSAALETHIAFDYAGAIVRASDARGLLRAPSSKPGDVVLIARDRESEEVALAQFLASGGRAERGDNVASDALVEAARLPVLVSKLIALGWTVDAEGVPYRRAGPVHVAVKSGIDWFELEGGIDFDGQHASMPALIAAAKRGERTVRLADGSLGILPERWLEQWGLVDAVGETRGDVLRFRRQQGWILDALLAARPEVELDQAFSEFASKLAAFEGIAPLTEPASFQGSLRSYQREGLGWFAFLRDMGLGGCLADDMGLGKTVQVLALLEERRATVRRPTLVVAPKSVVPNWIEEARRFTPNLTVVEYTGVERRAKLADLDSCDLVLTTYGTLRRDVIELKERAFDYVILDEAQTIKNVHSQAAKAARLLDASHRLALSGTPIENHIGDLWSLFEFLNPGLLGRAAAFDDLIASSGGDALQAETLGALERALRPFFLRRRKEEVLSDLPEKSEQILYCDLEGHEREEYADLSRHYRRTLLQRTPTDERDPQTFHVLEALLRLRQAACHPGLIDSTRSEESSAKLEVLLAHLEEVAETGHKALVFSQFTSFLSIVKNKLDDRGIAYEYLDGQTKKRMETIDRFQRDETCPLFLISLKAGGFGLNLTAADYVFLTDPWWNPATEMQAIDRTHRIGQKRKVMAYRLIARDTVEERVLELQAKKKKIVEQILGGQGTRLADLTREDLERLLS